MLQTSLVCAVVGLSSAARAEPDTRELAAESYFVEGVELMKRGQFAEALERLRASERLSSASGTLLDIAFCERQLGHTASAWLAYRQALGSADARGKSEHSAIARQGLSELEPDLPYLLLKVPLSQFAWSLQLDGAPLATRTGAPIPIDPGQHQLSGTAGGSTFRLQFSVAARERKEIELPEPQAPAPTSPVQPPPLTVTKDSPSPPSRRHDHTLAFVTGGLGAAAVLTGIAVFTHARLAFDSVTCPDGPDGKCDPAHASRQRSARNEAFVSYGIAGAGAALLGLGVGLWLAPTSSDTGARAALQLSLSPTGSGLVYRHAF